VIQHVRAGRLKGLRNIDPQALAPRAGRADDGGGRLSRFRVRGLSRLAAPAGIPEPVAVLLESEVLQVLASSRASGEVARAGHRDAPAAGAQAKAPHQSDAQLWAKVVKAANMRVD
jgi:hypothetical protein